MARLPTVHPQVEGVGLGPEDILHGDLVGLAVLAVRGEDGQP